MFRRTAASILPVLLLSASLRVSFAAFPQATRPQQQDSGENQFGTSITLFSTLAAINAAGYDAGMDSALNAKFKLRTQLREEMAKHSIPSLPELKDFYQQHKKPSAGADLGQYVSFALMSSGPPNFEVPNDQLPPDVEPIKGLSVLLARFYREADLETLWNRSQQAYNAAIGEYQDAVINTLFEANGYMRNPSGSLGRRFQIYLDLLGAPDQVQVRSFKSSYYVVITPTTVPVVDEIRDAYLAYVLDPLTFKYGEAIKSKKALEKYAQDAPALGLPYKDDFSLLVTKCLVKAVDSRLQHGEDKREAYVNQAMQEGFILTAAFAEQLQVYEKQQESLRIYYPDLINAVNVRKEEKRLKTVQFAQSVQPRVAAMPSKMQVDPAEATLEAAEGVYEQGQYEDAAKLFKKALEQTAEKGMQGRAYYGLARIAVRENKKEEAVELFQRTADANPEPAITAWAHVYLGRLALAAGDPDKANAEFKTALANEGASPVARQAAEKGLQSTSSPGDKQK